MTSKALGLIALCAAITATPGCLHAQVDPDSARRRNDCRIAAQLIERGERAPREAWAWQRMGFCHPALQAQTYLAALRQVRRDSDREVIGRGMFRVVHLRDGRLFLEVLDIAGDRSASVPARVMAFMALSRIRDPGSLPSYERFTAGLDEHGVPRRGCSARTMHPVVPSEGAVALPGDYLARIAAVSERVRMDPTEPDEIRSAAACS